MVGWTSAKIYTISYRTFETNPRDSNSVGILESTNLFSHPLLELLKSSNLSISYNAKSGSKTTRKGLNTIELRTLYKQNSYPLGVTYD